MGLGEAAVGLLRRTARAVPALRLDRRDHQLALAATVAQLQPKLLVLDPFVRLHCIDENVVADVAPILGYLRSL
jgi:hypothetical protein